MGTSKPIELATEIVAAFVSNNSVRTSDLAVLIELVHAALVGLASEGEGAPAPTEAKAPAVSVRKSITPDYLICLDDGKPYKSLRRHLTAIGVTPQQYRAKWNLPADYPMVAPNYAARRSAMAKESGTRHAPQGRARCRPAVGNRQAKSWSPARVKPQPAS